MTDENRKRRDAVLEDAVKKLHEFFDTVQIVATAVDDDGSSSTWSFAKGAGNYHARVASCRELVMKSDERARLEVADED